MCNGFLLVDTFVTVGKCTNIYLQLTNQVDRNNFVLLFRIQSKYTLFVVKRQGTVGRIRHLAGCLAGAECETRRSVYGSDCPSTISYY